MGQNKTNSSNIILNTLDAQLTNTVQLNNNASYRELSIFLKDHRSDDSEKTNIIDQGKKIAYAIPEKLIPRFFDSLEKCRREKLMLNFSEKQQDPSGLMLDFDILQENEKSQLDDSHFYTLTRAIMEIYSTMVDIGHIGVIKTWAIALRKPKTMYKQADECFKDGFHLIFPGIKMSKIAKKYLVKRILDEDVLEQVFEDVTFKGNIKEVLDKNSTHVVTLFPGSCKSGSVPYNIYRLYEISIKRVRSVTLIPRNLNEMQDINLAYDFSVNYERKDGLVVKNEYSFNDETLALITQWKCKPSALTKKIMNDLSILNMHDPDSAQLQRIIDILSVARCDEYKFWFSIVCALAYLSDRYKPLAYLFSGKRPKGVRVEFEKVWEDACANRGKYSYSKEMIYSYARADNPEEYKIIMNEGVFAKLTECIFDKKIGGYVDHWHIAQLLKEMVGNKFVVDVDGAGSPQWYEFVLADDKHVPGEIYKWRKSHDPYTLRNYISIKVPIIFDRALEFLNEKKNNSEDETTTKYYNNLIRVLSQSSRKLFNTGFKSGVIQEASTIFRKMNFTRKMDQETTDIMGVANGVLVLGKVPYLVKSYHSYKISRFSAVEYHKLDVNDSTIKEVFKALWELFPVGEKDVFHYIMFFMATSLTARIKACYLLTLRGGGANGKSFLMELIRNLMGSVDDNGYGYKMPIQFLIERERASNNATPVLMPLQWARMTYFSESDKSEQLRVAKMKLLTSQEPVNGRANYGDTVTFTPRSNYIFTTNYHLTIDSTDHGTWRRQRYYTAKIRFCNNPNPENRYERKADPAFTEKKTRDPVFLSGFLSILTMYFGVMEMEYNGDIRKIPCPTIEKETEIFRNSQDTINRFITERVVITADPERETRFAELVDMYCRWYTSNIKERRHDRLDISLMFKNSRLCNNVIKCGNGSLALKGRRVLGPEEEKDDDEQFVVQINQPGANNIDGGDANNENVDDSGVALNKMHERYLKLLKKHNIDE
jgi:phage/plasmid-associated DNA primase